MAMASAAGEGRGALIRESQGIECTLDDDCLMCSGEACLACGAGIVGAPGPIPYCEHDTIDRHDDMDTQPAGEAKLKILPASNTFPGPVPVMEHDGTIKWVKP